MQKTWTTERKVWGGGGDIETCFSKLGCEDGRAVDGNSWE